MKISYNWLKTVYRALKIWKAHRFTLHPVGLEVKVSPRLESVKAGFKGHMPVGKSLECVKHPNADKLNLLSI
jgi:tRNA-binding EMAP/Myf-like protein